MAGLRSPVCFWHQTRRAETRAGGSEDGEVRVCGVGERGGVGVGERRLSKNMFFDS